MNLKQLQQFIALAETGNFHRAAEQLHMAQPPLSISIRKLEEELGSALFDRTSTGVVLTPAGKACWRAHARPVHAEQCRQAVRDTRKAWAA
jgi:DNA-binding transcriptional LysR family regulator